jgi:hypothetical protein
VGARGDVTRCAVRIGHDDRLRLGLRLSPPSDLFVPMKVAAKKLPCAIINGCGYGSPRPLRGCAPGAAGSWRGRDSRSRVAGKDEKTYGCGSLLALFLLRRRSVSNSNKQRPRLVAQKNNTALWLSVNAHIQSCVRLLPTPLAHEKPP